MGLLDEAIRDHLELKRRHGADPGEVARIEHEALGPARREPVATAAVPSESPPEPELADDEYGYEDEVPADERLEAPVHHDPPPAPAEPEAAPEPPAQERDQPTQQFSLEELESASEAPHEPEDPPAAGSADDVVAADEEPDAHDELEETPEFLQETPEHDRLWFEQKPPRDFDF
jgi:hypothetical protein